MNTNTEPNTELATFNAIRVETALSRYPVHRLARKGSIDIDIREENETGEVTIKWEVDSSRKHGQPGPLAYKLDTLIVNRRIEEATRPIPRVIRLGSLHEICKELGLTEGENKNSIKKALYQNASAFIRAKIRYRQNDGGERTLEAGFTRYSVVFTGEKLPDGRSADAVYLILNDIYMKVINGAMSRPLDYDYLKDLPPGPQRFYELLSYQMYAALKHDRARAKLIYSHLCTYSPQTRYLDWEQARKQMAKVHAPHKKSGYIVKIEYQQTEDNAGKPDWIMFYTPGPKARAQYRAFARKGGTAVLEIEQQPETSEPSGEPTGLVAELIGRDVTRSVAEELVLRFSAETIGSKIEVFDWLLAKKDKRIEKNPAGWLVKAIQEDYAVPKGFVSKAERAKREEASREARRREEGAARVKREEREREQGERDATDAYLKALSPEERAEIDRIAAAQVEADGLPEPLARMGLDIKRRAHVRQLLQDAGKLPA